MLSADLIQQIDSFLDFNSEKISLKSFKELLSIIPDDVLSHKEKFAVLVKYLIYKGIFVSSQDFKAYLSTFKGSDSNPQARFWIAYDALIRGHLNIFRELWNSYESIELKHYSLDFKRESIVISEDPIFINVAELVHDHQQRLIKAFVMEGKEKDKLSETEYDEILKSFLVTLTPLLAFFRIQHIQFERNITIKDLQRLEELFVETKIHSLGNYWELRIHTLLAYWRLDIGVETLEKINFLKQLNSIANNTLIESQIFHLEALYSIKHNNIDNFNHLINSALYLAKEYGFIFQQAEVLLTKSLYDRANFFDHILEIEKLTNERDHKFVRSKAYILVSSYYISSKDWDKAETELLKASKFLQDKFDLNSYYKVIADFSYVLLVTKQLNESLESCQVLLEDEVPILYRLRGFYLYSLATLLLKRTEDAIKFLEEGLRIGLTYKDEIILPWFYELLGLIYYSKSDWETALHYLDLTCKAYFDLSRNNEAYRGTIVVSYLSTLNKNYGAAFTKLQNVMVNEISEPTLLFELLWALQLVIILSKEEVPFSDYEEIWNQNVSPFISIEDNPLVSLFSLKSDIFLSPKGSNNKVYMLSDQLIDPIDMDESILTLEYLCWQLIFHNQKTGQQEHIRKVIMTIDKLISLFKIKIETVLKLQQSLLGNIKSNKTLDTDLLFQSAIIFSILRISSLNFPFPEFISLL